MVKMGRLLPLPPPQFQPSLNTLLQSLVPVRCSTWTGGKTGFGLLAVPTLACLPLPAWKAALDPFAPRMTGPSNWPRCFDFTAPEKRLSVNRNTGRRLASPPPSITFYRKPSSDKRLPQPCSPSWPWITAQRTPHPMLRGRGGSIPKHKLFCSTPGSARSPASVLEVFLALSEPQVS